MLLEFLRIPIFFWLLSISNTKRVIDGPNLKIIWQQEPLIAQVVKDVPDQIACIPD